MMRPIFIGRVKSRRSKVRILAFDRKSRPCVFMLPEHDWYFGNILRSDLFIKCCAKNSREMFNGWVQPCELRLLIEHVLLVIADYIVEMLFHILNIHEIAMLIEFCSFEL